MGKRVATGHSQPPWCNKCFVCWVCVGVCGVSMHTLCMGTKLTESLWIERIWLNGVSFSFASLSDAPEIRNGNLRWTFDGECDERVACVHNIYILNKFSPSLPLFVSAVHTHTQIVQQQLTCAIPQMTMRCCCYWSCHDDDETNGELCLF